MQNHEDLVIYTFTNTSRKDATKCYITGRKIRIKLVIDSFKQICDALVKIQPELQSYH